MTITEGYPEPLALYNASTVAIVITQDLGGTAQGAPLPPGGSIVWDPGRPLAAQSPDGDGTLIVLANSSPIMNVAEALVDLLGLAPLIAANISIAGAPPLNAFTSVWSGNASGAAGAVSPVTDVSQWQSLDLVIAETNAGGFTAPLPRKVTLLWDNNLTDVFYVTDANAVIAGVATHVSVPVRSPNVQIVIDSNARAGTIIYNVNGSYRTTPALTYSCDSAYGTFVGGAQASGVAGERYCFMDFGNQGVGAQSSWPPVIAGAADLAYRVQTPAGSTATLQLVDAISGAPHQQVTAPASTLLTGNLQLIVPNRPLRLISTVAGAAATRIYAAIAYAS